MKKNKISKNWLNQQKNDSYFRNAKIKGYRSRSAYKLIEMNKKFKFLKKNSTVLDLGSSPGGWSQVASKETTKSKILAVDIKNMEAINNVKFIKGDFNEPKNLDKIFFYFKNNKIDVVLSDMATNTTGNKTLDSYNTGKLCLDAMNLAKKVLSNDGVFLSKIFMGSIFLEIHEKAKNSFQKVVKYKPQSSKKESKEIYIYCKGVLKV
ncbi:RlmE family RNA methyltransferase [bacterium]|nr:RlmE family RNA methyltransferase [bacterium]